MTQRDWQKDMEMMKGTFEFDWTNYQDLQIEMGKALPYWLQEAKERGEREQRLKEAVQKIKRLAEQDYIRHQTDQMYLVAKDILSTLYPDTPAPKEETE